MLVRLTGPWRAKSALEKGDIAREQIMTTLEASASYMPIDVHNTLQRRCDEYVRRVNVRRKVNNGHPTGSPMKGSELHSRRDILPM